MEEEVLTKNFVGWIVAFILFISLSITAIYARGLGDRLDALERHQEEQDIAHKTELDCTNLYIESVKNDLTTSLKEQQEQIDSQAEQINKVKQVQSTTNKAFTRFQKQQEQVEADLREELKKD